MEQVTSQGLFFFFSNIKNKLSPLFVQFQAIQAFDSTIVVLVERTCRTRYSWGKAGRQTISHLLDFIDRYFPLHQLLHHAFFF